MKGIVEIVYSNGDRESCPNMIMDGGAKIIVDALTANPALAQTSASAILDASNYMIHAMTFGKEHESYNLHAHDPKFAAYTGSDGIVRVLSGPGQYAYVASAEPNIGVIPYSDPTHTRLEQRNTYVSSYEDGLTIYTPPENEYDVGNNPTDVGHNPNVIHNLSDNRETMGGCWPASGGTQLYILSSLTSPNTPLTYTADFPAPGTTYTESYTFSGEWNTSGYMTRSGFLIRDCSNTTFGDTLVAAQTAASSIDGRLLIKSNGVNLWDSPPTVTFQTALNSGNYVFASVFGGIRVIGLWAIDIERTVSLGRLPPYDMFNLDAAPQFKLFAKKVFDRDIVAMNGNVPIVNMSSYEIYKDGTLLPVDDNETKLVINWGVSF